MIPIKEVELKSINDGEVLRLFDEKLTEVRENIKDTRTSWFNERKIIIELSISPEGEDRETAKICCRVSSKLAPIGVRPIKVDLTDQLYFKEQGFPVLKGVTWKGVK